MENRQNVLFINSITIWPKTIQEKCVQKIYYCGVVLACFSFPSPETLAPACWATGRTPRQKVLPSRLWWATAENRACIWKSEFKSRFQMKDLARSTIFRHLLMSSGLACSSSMNLRYIGSVSYAFTSHQRPIHILLCSSESVFIWSCLY